jgi:ABC-type transport system involved in multi-copper enzyme maturation permease subunit
MLRAIAGKELLIQLVSFRFWVGALLTAGLAASSTLITARDYNQRLNRYLERVGSAQRELSAVTVYSFLQPLVVRPPEPLSILDQGFDSRLGTEVSINLFAVPAVATGGEQGNELLASVPAMDLTLVVSLVLGLLALFLTCDAVTSEREVGTLKVVLAYGVARRTVLAGKLSGNLIAISLPLAAGLLASLTILRFEVAAPLTADQRWRVAGLLCAYLAFLCLMLLLGLFISLSVRSSSQALITSVLVWFVLTILLPGVAGALAGGLGAASGVKRDTDREIAALTARFNQRLAAERRRAPLLTRLSGHSASSFVTNERRRAVRYRYGSAPYYDSLAAYYRCETRTGIEYAAQVFAVRERYEARLKAQERLAAALAALSPAALLDRLSAAFSGTSVAEYDRFLAASQRYRLALLAYLAEKDAFRSWRWFTDDPPGELQPWPRYFGLTPEQVAPDQASRLFSRLSEPAIAAQVRRDRAAVARDPTRRLALDDLPPFTYPGPRLLGALRHGAAAAIALLLLDALAAAAVWARWRRYELG